MLTIDNFNKDVNQMMIWGWDLVNATEFDDTYLFILAKRAKPEDKVFFTLGRELQVTPVPYYPEMLYQLYMTDERMEWTERLWLRERDVRSYVNFLSIIEGVLEKYYGHA